MDDLTDELILYYYSIFMEAALEQYGLKDKDLKDIHADTLG